MDGKIASENFQNQAVYPTHEVRPPSLQIGFTLSYEVRIVKGERISTLCNRVLIVYTQFMNSGLGGVY